jgi:hypothetical protein
LISYIQEAKVDSDAHLSELMASENKQSEDMKGGGALKKPRKE